LKTRTASAQTPTDLLTRDEALTLLGVKKPTLYTYVSRGWIRSLPVAGTRSHVFAREDVERVHGRSQSHAGHAARAETAMRYGEPVITTRLTDITPEGPRYRGHLATALAREGWSYEAVASLLWTGSRGDEQLIWQSPPPAIALERLVRSLDGPATQDEIIKVLASAVLALGVHTHSTQEPARGDTLEAGRQIIQLLTGCLGLLAPAGRYRPVRKGESIAAGAARALGVTPTPAVVRALNAMMVVCADYELTPSNFSARVVASSGADLHACVVAGLCAHGGTFTGRTCERLEELLRKHPTRAGLRRQLDAVRRDGVRIYAFNHPLHPTGDPRARWLIELAQAHVPQSAAFRNTLWFYEQLETECHAYPGLPAGLVALQIALGLPRRSMFALWAIARAAGQIAHVIEQRTSGYVLRPRARFISD
jgi:citrate synthase